MNISDIRIPHLSDLKRRFFRRRESEQILRDRYKRQFKRELETENPTTFTEKLFKRMILGNRGAYPIFTKLSDKITVRAFIERRVGVEYLTKLLWTGSDPRKIPYDHLPEHFIIKTNHGCGTNIAVRNNADRASIEEQLSRWLRINYYWEDREFQYLDIEAKILVEELLCDDKPDGPLDYRFWCFDGTPKLIQVDNNRHSINPFYSINWEELNLSYRSDFEHSKIDRPKNLEEMLDVASAISRGFDFVRVDLYNINGRIVFGEMTFTPVAGRLLFSPPDWDIRLGNLWHFSDRAPDMTHEA